MSFVKRLKEARKESQLTQEQLGIEAGLDEAVASSRMNHYERGRREPDFLMLKKIAKILNLPVSYFFAEKDDEAFLIKTFHRMKNADKKLVLDFIQSILER